VREDLQANEAGEATEKDARRDEDGAAAAARCGDRRRVGARIQGFDRWRAQTR
jgi:hypothetical protein